jgi:hypothetical protein
VVAAASGKFCAIPRGTLTLDLPEEMTADDHRELLERWAETCLAACEAERLILGQEGPAHTYEGDFEVVDEIADELGLLGVHRGSWIQQRRAARDWACRQPLRDDRIGCERASGPPDVIRRRERPWQPSLAIPQVRSNVIGTSANEEWR